MDKHQFNYEESLGGENVVLLLHGLFGATGNFEALRSKFSMDYNVVAPVLPIMSLPLKELSLGGLVEHIEEFIDYKGYNKVNIVGNSLGGHLAQLYALKQPEKVNTITLTGSSGLFESAMGSTFPKRGDYDFVKKKAEDIFYDPNTATKEIIDEVYETVNNRDRAIRVIVTAKSAVRNNLAEKIGQIYCPVLLVWGREDKITPSWVGEKFHSLLPNSQLEILKKCGHAPMMERPHEFNNILSKFLVENC